MRMNSVTGKRILSLVREGDYAHPGEELAIDLVFGKLAPDAGRRLLDVGCGLGGTADYVRRHGWGEVTGVDIDAETLAEAVRRYPRVGFTAADVTTIGEQWQEEFDLIYLFNSFYAFPDQSRALLELQRVAREGASLVIFDYTDVDGSFRQAAGERHAFWTPVNLETFPAALCETGWEFIRSENITAEYLTWYRDLCRRIEAKKDVIIDGFGREWYDYAYDTYADLLSLVQRKIVGGAIIHARRA